MYYNLANPMSIFGFIMQNLTNINLKHTLDKLYHEYNFKNNISNDPIEFPHQFNNDYDIEIVGFIASSFAYGRINLFKSVIKNILTPMGKNPYDFIVNFSHNKQCKFFSGINYRFSTNDDIILFLSALHRIIIEFKTLENLFKNNYNNDDNDIGNALMGFVKAFYKPIFNKSAGFRFLIPDPQKNSPCKRLNLFLRWMIRDKDIDLGIWKGIPKNKLIIPLDTHIARISRCIGLTKRKSEDWKTAVEITESLKLLDPEDPLKYDFVLCHYGVNKLCSSKVCKECRLQHLYSDK